MSEAKSRTAGRENRRLPFIYSTNLKITWGNGTASGSHFYVPSTEIIMKNLIEILIILGFVLLGISAKSQTPTQTIRGAVVDKENLMPLIGAEVAVMTTVPVSGTTTDEHGHFKIENVPVGRHNLRISYLGYEAMGIPNLMVTSGKEVVLNLELVESTVQLAVATVVAGSDKSKTLNEMATVSARSFSVEETSRYAGSFYDPARMATNYAGVSVGSSDDLTNEIVVRGNSPRGVMWRLEGVEIPNPNHFGSMGNSGGGISMLSSSTLSNSDFYTGAFPAEFGNALSGVFDLNMRTGNNEQREYALMLGALGLEAAAEGPFSSRQSQAGSRQKGSYLVNFRYSTLALLDAVGLSPVGDVLPKYSDVSFKLNMPTEKAGNFALFGLGGQNSAVFHPDVDSSNFDAEIDDEWGFEETQTVGNLGLSHRILLSDHSYLKTVVLASHEHLIEEDYWIDPERNFSKHYDVKNEVASNAIRFSSMYNHKFNARNTFRTGLIYSYMTFDFKYYDDDNYDEEKGDGQILLFNNDGATATLQGYAQWKHRFNAQWTLNAGLHYSQMLLNNKFSIEPRAALSWKIDKNQSLTAAVGLHSKMEHLAAYLFEGTLPDGTVRVPNKDLGLTKSMHAVLGYDRRLGENMRMKLEAYYQHLFDVPVESIPGSTYSIINATDIWDIIGVEQINNEGTGRNYGIDLTLEKFFSNGYYFLVTGSLFESRYTPINKVEFPTRFDGRYNLTVLGGKEFKVGKSKKNIIGINGKLILTGGNRFTPIDLEASRQSGDHEIIEDQRFAEWAGAYGRFDFGISYKINKSKLTHTIMLDIQNVTNRQNIFTLYYDDDTQQIERYTQNGLFPIINYRIEF
ncbi:MAG: TonB-dependent receptor [Bacteroidota bacterium]